MSAMQVGRDGGQHLGELAELKRSGRSSRTSGRRSKGMSRVRELRAATRCSRFAPELRWAALTVPEHVPYARPDIDAQSPG
jgi:hypothetical protein